jgi:heptosyltransferase I
VTSVKAIYAWQYAVRQRAVARRFRRGTPPAPAEPQRVLLVVSGLLGDTVMSTPVLAEARRLWPEAHITLLGGPANCELLAGCPLLDERKAVSVDPFSISGRGEVEPLKAWLRDSCFDVALILLGDQFAGLLAEVGIPIRVGVRGHPLAPCLTHTYSIGSPREWGPSERLGALGALGCDVVDVPPRLWVREAGRLGAKERLAELGLPLGEPYIVIHPFGSTPRQHWPLDRAAEVADGLREATGLRMVVVGGPETRGRLPAAVRERAIDATGALGIQELLGAIEGAEQVASTDSGPFHMAGALRRPLLGIFRARRPEHAARYPGARVVFGQCEPCDAGCRWDRCRTEPCGQMLAVSAAQVLEAMRRPEPRPAEGVETR